MDLRFPHPTEIYSLRPCRNPEAPDLIAIGGEHLVEVVQFTDTDCICATSFHVGSRISAIAWSSRTISPSFSDDWFIELVVASADFGLHILIKSPNSSEIFPFGGGLSGHHGKVNDITFCGGPQSGWDEDSSRYVATVSDDKMLMVWDLYPNIDMSSIGHSSPADLERSPSSVRPQPTAYVIPFSHPLTSIRCHPGASKEFLVSDCRGSVFLTDWRTDPDENDDGSLRHSNLVELLDPFALSNSCMGTTKVWSASVDWRVDSVDIIGGVFGHNFVIWDVSKLKGGTPTAMGNTFPEGGHIFRWCYTHPEYFALTTHTPSRGAVLHVYNSNYMQAPPTVFTLCSKPQYIRNFDFLSVGSVPRIAATVGRTLIIFSIGVES